MSSSKKLEQYIKKNQGKAAPQEEAPRSYNATPRNAGDFLTFVRLLNGMHVTIFFAIALVVAGVGFYTRGEGTTEEKLSIMLLSGLGLIMLYSLYYLIQYARYRKFISNKLYNMQGWNEFVQGLSPAFWKEGTRYVYIVLNISPQPTATAAHPQAVEIFLEKCLSRWGSGHTGKWTKGSPDNFKREGFALMGHICIHKGMIFLIRTLLYRVPSFVDIVGAENIKLSITRRGERSFSAEVEEDPYETERERKWRDGSF